jgi:hypothetical protein
MFIKLISLIFISSVKFIFAFPVAFEYKLNVWETIAATTAGGVSGIFFFAFISDYLIVRWHRFRLVFFHRKTRIKAIPKIIEHKLNYSKDRIFTNKNKRYVRLKQRFGLFGIALLTPIILSIPLGTFHAIRFYRRKKSTLFALVLAVVIWSFVLSSLLYFFEIRLV